MTGSYRHAICAVLALLLLAAAPKAPAVAQEPGDGERGRAEEMAREGMERILRALELFMESIPQYELPEVNQHGDIIIRRKRRSEDGTPARPEAEPDAADT